MDDIFQMFKVRRMSTSLEKYRDTKLMNFTNMQPSSCNQVKVTINIMYKHYNVQKYWKKCFRVLSLVHSIKSFVAKKTFLIKFEKDISEIFLSLFYHIRLVFKIIKVIPIINFFTCLACNSYEQNDWRSIKKIPYMGRKEDGKKYKNMTWKVCYWNIVERYDSNNDDGGWIGKLISRNIGYQIYTSYSFWNWWEVNERSEEY